MPRIIVLIAIGFRKLYEKIAKWLENTKFESLFLALPKDFEPFLRAFVHGSISEYDFWKSYEYLTNFHEPFINSLKYKIVPILNCLRSVFKKNKHIKLYCYKNLSSYVKINKISEKILLLGFKSKISNKININEWKSTLKDEIDLIKDSWFEEINNIIENACFHNENVLLYNGSIKPLKECLELNGFEVKLLLLEQIHWYPPLDVLRALISTRGIEKIKDEEVEACIKSHIKYLDYILLSENIDLAYESWIKDNIAY
jgi:hypothetical protein